MKLHTNAKTLAKSQNWQGINDASIGPNTTFIRIQSKSDFPNFILIKNKGDSPPGCAHSSGSSMRLHTN